MADMTSTADAPRSPGRPRSIRADEAIIEATLDLLAEGSTIEALSIEAIATRAGVGKATIYRRWAGKDALLLDALRRLKGVMAQPAGHSVRDDLVLLVGAIGKNVDPRAAKIMPCLAPAVNRSADQFQLYQNIISPRRQLMREVLRRGIDEGVLRADIDVEVTMALLTGPMLIQRVLQWNPDLDEQTLPERVVDAVLDGIQAR
ncbi:TetR family transcriptional regulator [Micromonospora ureilytica]|uniref:TetR family transcriptional regulator n=2 Tax=Micromonospora ureilytica TaxID=709868 RepID=A0A3N9YGD3_9ACTN|nr:MULTISPECIES: TetR/AcrR family transcriptional regulator [Micromonospora]MBQ1022160.1 TetR/AcrR family transcriptional regulator [Micromonospora sp. D93]RQX18627.1 TetR family transcriptional regulator [Micromonospora ureilytica]WSG29862.1 TetR/AcrR family transcriptional regulator [Micromonospora ureilytica]WSR53707.1 TetR/AcrR family transcriptional regulator [Micromonospora ureilytica]